MYNEVEEAFKPFIKKRRIWPRYMINDKPGSHICYFAPSESWHVRARDQTCKRKPSIIVIEIGTEGQWNQYKWCNAMMNVTYHVS